MPKIRIGKTAKDRASGATARNLDNKSARVSWQQEARPTNTGFPIHTCNGRRNRYWILKKSIEGKKYLVARSSK